MNAPNLTIRLRHAGRSLAYSLLVLLVLVAGPVGGASTNAMTVEQRRAYDRGVYYFNTEANACDIVLSGVAATGSTDLTATQVENAKTIMGIAKTLGVGKQGALIGLITALVESGLKNYANSGSWHNDSGGAPYTSLGPVSLALPHDAVGNDHDSVGIMQQRAIDGHWGPVDPKADLVNNVKWLMTPAYAAEAFFATPAGKLETKAMIKVAGWETMPPGNVAQAVQGSAFPDRYATKIPDAQKYLTQYWDTVPAIPLPVPLGTAGVPAATQGQNCTGLAGSAKVASILTTILKYAWPTYRDAPYFTTAQVAYQSAIRKASSNNEYVGGGCYTRDVHCGIDCGAFVTRVIRDSGADPEYNKYQGNTTQQLRYLKESTTKYEKVVGTDGKPVNGTEDLHPGDIAISDDSVAHTYIYVGNVPKFDGVAASASIGPQWRAPMADGAWAPEEFEWYRLK